ncbi:MAG: hypothetical protein SRB1_01203 [Desulfobacteraceae bacterium Eth-SRB1]|nr:MAG: hypothetical protein SRB1_01203 [Desulfobacteraceae bacterium Eth-SRB1]
MALVSYKLTENFSISRAIEWINQEEVLDIFGLEGMDFPDKTPKLSSSKKGRHLSERVESVKLRLKTLRFIKCYAGDYNLIPKLLCDMKIRTIGSTTKKDVVVLDDKEIIRLLNQDFCIRD